MLLNHQRCFYDHPFYVPFFVYGGDERIMNEPSLVSVIMHVCFIKTIVILSYHIAHSLTQQGWRHLIIVRFAKRVSRDFCTTSIRVWRVKLITWQVKKRQQQYPPSSQTTATLTPVFCRKVFSSHSPSKFEVFFSTWFAPSFRKWGNYWRSR